ncbi:DHA2 family efflux MFS transporter permease subunit [Micromonospora sp. NPDC049903]|uniref:DHA2 family efflux MFS transporter permease subunit n=1 Tax=Micromonospora sp. NPDC049903 TaxID=3364276 RepID=UPI00379200A5
MSMKTGDDRLDAAQRRLVAVILLGGALGILNSTMVAVGIDRLAREFDTSLGVIGWVSTGFLLAVTVTIPVTAWAGDRFGGRRMWLAGLGLFVLASLACGLAWNAGSLIAFRVLQGVGAGILDPLVLTLLARTAGPRRAGRVMGLMAAVLSLGPVLGPVLGGIVVQGLGWQWMFLLSVPVGVLAFALARAVMPTDPPQGTATRLDVVGVMLLGPGFAGLLLTLSQAADRADFVTWSALVPLTAGVLLVGGYVVHALRRDHPLVDLRLFTRGGFAVSVVVMALSGVTMYASLVVLPLYFQQAGGHGALAAGLLVAPLGIGGALAAPLAGRVSDRIGSRNLVLAGGLLAALAAFALTRVDIRTHGVWVVLAGVAIGVGLGFVGPPAMGALYRTLPPPLVPQGSSVLYMLNQFGGSVGVAVVAFVLDTASDPLSGLHGVYWFLAAAIVLLLAVGARLPGRPTIASPDVPVAVGAG